MNDPTSAREALLAELIGDVAALLDRVDTLVPLLEGSRADLMEASAKLDAHAAKVEGRIDALTQASVTHAIKHIARLTDEAARGVVEVQAQAMKASARELFQRELAPALKRLAQIAGNANRCVRWWAYAGTAALASVISCAAAAFLLSR